MKYQKRPPPVPRKKPEPKLPEYSEAYIEDFPVFDAIDETAADELYQYAKKEAGEGNQTLSELYESIAPEKRAAFYAEVRNKLPAVRTGRGTWNVIGNKAPKNLEFFWMSKRVVANHEGGERGWTKVKRTKTTQEWVPYAPQTATGPYITHGEYTLMAISKDVFLQRVIARAEESNSYLRSFDDYPSALKYAKGVLALSDEELAEVERITGGIIISRGSDPSEQGGKPDLVDDGGGVEAVLRELGG